MKSFFAQYRNWIIGAVIVVIAGGAFFLFQNGNGDEKNYELYTVKRDRLDQSLEVTGTLEPAETIDLSFQNSGQVAEVFVQIGERVSKGDTLARLENSDEGAKVQEAQASLNEAQAALNLELADAKDEDIAIAQADVDKAESNVTKAEVELQNAKSQQDNVKKSVDQDIAVAELALEDAQLNLEKVKEQSTTDIDENVIDVEGASLSLKSRMGQLFSQLAVAIQTVDQMYGFYGPEVITDDIFTGEGRDDYLDLKELLLSVNTEHERLEDIYLIFSSTPTDEEYDLVVDDLSELTKDAQSMMLKAVQVSNDEVLEGEYSDSILVQLRIDIRAASDALNSAISSYDAAKSTYDDALLQQSSGDVTLPLDVESAELLVSQREQELEKTKVQGDISIDDAENKVKSLEADVSVQESLLESSKASLNKVLSDPRDVDLGPYRARVDQASARLNSAQTVYNKTLLKAPLNGILTQREVDFGEQVTFGSAAGAQVAFQMIDDNEFHIEVKVPETQIGKVTQESEVTVQFDSIGRDEEFEGDIVSIEPGSTEIDGIVYYKVKVALIEKDDRLKAGMTADVFIKALPKENALVIPEVAIFKDQGRKWVYIPTDDPKKRDQAEVRTGIRGTSGIIEIVSGLEEGDQILVPK